MTLRFLKYWGFGCLTLGLLLLLFSYVAEAETAAPIQATGYYQMDNGEVYEMRCDVKTSDQIQPAVNMVLQAGQWRVIVACPEVVTVD